MIVWLDTKNRGYRVPSWLRDSSADELIFASVDTDQGMLYCHKKYTDCLTYKTDADWFDVGGGYKAALYQTFTPIDYIRPLKDTMVIQIEDETGALWHVPAILHPNGAPAVGMRRRLDDEGNWIREPATELTKTSVDVAIDARPHALENFENINEETQNNWLLTILENLYYINALTFAKLGLIGDTLFEKGIKTTCGLLEMGEQDAA